MFSQLATEVNTKSDDDRDDVSFFVGFLMAGLGLIGGICCAYILRHYIC